MHDMNAIVLKGRSRQGLRDIHSRVFLTASAMAFLSFLLVVIILLWHAFEERHALIRRGLSVAITSANLLDREVQSLANLLKGLSRSLHLQDEDFAAFHEQPRNTPQPNGVSFILWGMDRQWLNTRRPFGTPLPRVADLPGVQEWLILSGRVDNPTAGMWTISVSFPLDNARSEVIHVLSLVMPGCHIEKVVRNGSEPAGCTTIILDRRIRTLMEVRPSTVSITRDLLGRLWENSMKLSMRRQDTAGSSST